jgi:hypothetical protein
MDAARRTDGDLGYIESFSPGRGFVPARASQARGSQRLSLNGTWKFRYCESLGDLTPGFEGTDFDDSRFGDIAVPSCWQLAGVPGPPRYGAPAYTNVTYPFPVDPPRVRMGRRWSASTGSTRASPCSSTARPWATAWAAGWSGSSI